jgi:Tfp pilus assembly protein PilO
VNARYRTYQSREETLSSHDNFARIRDELRDIHEKLSAKLAVISSGMGNPQDLSALLQMLIDRAKAADIRFVKMQPQSESTHADYIQYPVLLEMETTYHSLGQFVVALESMPHVVKIDRLAITAGSSGKIDAKLLVTCFLQRT